MLFNVFGRNIEIIRSNNGWRVFYPGTEGKKRLAEDVVIPATVEESELIRYLEDVFHEWATASNNSVSRIK